MPQPEKPRPRSDNSQRDEGMRADQERVRQRLEKVVRKQFGDIGQRRVKRELRQVVEWAGIPWDTFYRKLTGRRRIQEADVLAFARAFGLNPEWFATGEGRVLDDRPLDPLVLTGGRATYKRPRGRPRKKPDPKRQLRLGWRVTGAAKGEPPERVAVDEMVERLTKPLILPKPLRFPRLEVLNELVAVELAQAEPARSAVRFLLNVTVQITKGLDEYWRFDPGPKGEDRLRQPLRLLSELRGELEWALEVLDAKGGARSSDRGNGRYRSSTD